MNLAAEAPQWLALIVTVLLVAAAAEDAVRLRISNLIVLLVLVGAIVAVVVAGPELALWKNFVVFLALLAIGTPMFAAGKLGGGDVKLLAAVGLWFDFTASAVDDPRRRARGRAPCDPGVDSPRLWMERRNTPPGGLAATSRRYSLWCRDRYGSARYDGASSIIIQA